MRKIPLLFTFSLALFFALFGSVFLPNSRLLAFSPFLAIVYHRSTFLNALWIASLCGLILDLCSSGMRLGAHSLNFCLTTLLLYRQKRHFFEDKPLSLSLFTIPISTVSSILHLLLLSSLGKTLPISTKMVITDLLVMPFFDAIYAFLWFSCPMMIYMKSRHLQWRSLFTRLYRLLPVSPSKRGEE